jgi:hypothetical protein
MTLEPRLVVVLADADTEMVDTGRSQRGMPRRTSTVPGHRDTRHGWEGDVHDDPQPDPGRVAAPDGRAPA